MCPFTALEAYDAYEAVLSVEFRYIPVQGHCTECCTDRIQNKYFLSAFLIHLTLSEQDVNIFISFLPCISIYRQSSNNYKQTQVLYLSLLRMATAPKKNGSATVPQDVLHQIP